MKSPPTNMLDYHEPRCGIGSKPAKRRENSHLLNRAPVTLENVDDGEDNSASKDTTTKGEPYCVRSEYEKVFIVSFTSFGMIICMIATNIILPVIPVLEEDYRMKPAQMNLVITVYMIIQGLSPALMSALSDLQGRRLAWILALSLYTMANVLLALQHSYVALLVLRCIQSIGSSCAIPFGFAVVADISSPAERGRYIGPMHGSVMAAFAFGPAFGGLLGNRFGWRSIFWFLATASGSFLLGYIIVIPETARNVVGNGSVHLKHWWRKPLTQIFQTCRWSTKRGCIQQEQPSNSEQGRDPRRTTFSDIFKAFTILKEKDALILIVYTSLLYFGISALWATTANHFGTLYDLNTLYVGLSFLPFGISGGLGSIVSGKLIDFNYQRISKSLKSPTTTEMEIERTNFPFEVARLQVAIPFMLVATFSFIAYGWILETRSPLALSLTFQALIGLGGTPLLGIIYTLLIDVFPRQAAATSGSADLIRCWLGAISAAVIDYMLSAMGWGWSFTFIGLTMVAALPSIGLVYLYGHSWRKAREAGIQSEETFS